jgi:hypothetical protein
MRSIKPLLLTLTILVVPAISGLFAQQPAKSADSGLKEWTTEEDHQNMMQRLGIRLLNYAPAK